MNREHDWAALRLPGHATHMMPRCRPPPELVAEAAASFPRVIGIGLPHTGTTTLHTLLLLQGCCFAVHNHPSGFSSRQATAFERRCGVGGNPYNMTDCDAELIAEARHWQCITDNPWAMRWELLVANAPLGTRFVLTTFPSALHYGVSRALASMGVNRMMKWSPGSEQDDLIRSHAVAYANHVRRVRWRLRGMPTFLEVCWPCGDNASSLLSVLPRSAASDASATLLPMPTRKMAGERRQRAAAILRRKISQTVCNAGFAYYDTPSANLAPKHVDIAMYRLRTWNSTVMATATLCSFK